MITNIIEKIKNRNVVYGTISNEILPRFHDMFYSTNKEFLELKDDDVRVKLYEIESQNGVPVKFKKGFEKENSGRHLGSSEHTVNGLKAGMSLLIMNGGYLQNRNSTYTIILVTDKFIYAKCIESNYISIKSHEEIKKIREAGCLKEI